MDPLTIGLLIGGTMIATTAIGAGMAYASKPEYPEQPDYAKTNSTVRQAEFDTLPGRRAVEQAARLGTKVRYPTGQKAPVYSQSEGYYDYKDQVWVPKLVGYQDVYAEADFTGQGDVQKESDNAREMARAVLENQQKYGVDYVNEAKRQLELSDPTGTAGRKQLYEMVMDDLQSPAPERPVASELDSQIAEQLRSDKLPQDVSDEVKKAVLNSTIADQGLTDSIQSKLQEEGETGNRIADQQRMLQWLTSGATQQDVEYRRKQQAMSNVSNFLAGRTPQAQFGQLSGAQQGASPNATAPSLPNFGNAGQDQAIQGASQQYATRVQAAADQVNPWLVGLSSAMNLAGTGISAYGATNNTSSTTTAKK